MWLSFPFVCAAFFFSLSLLEGTLPLFVFYSQAFMLMRPLLKMIFRRLNSMLKPQSASIMDKWREGASLLLSCASVLGGHFVQPISVNISMRLLQACMSTS